MNRGSPRCARGDPWRCSSPSWIATARSETSALECLLFFIQSLFLQGQWTRRSPNCRPQGAPRGSQLGLGRDSTSTQSSATIQRREGRRGGCRGDQKLEHIITTFHDRTGG